MRRRISLAILLTTIAALLLAGLGTLVLDRLGARSETERELRSQAEGLAAVVAPSAGSRGAPGRPALGRIVSGFKLEGIDFVFVGPEGRVFGELPSGVDPSRLDTAALLAGDTLSGHEGRLVYAAAPSPTRQGGVLVAVLTREVDTAPGRAFRWFLLSAGFTIVLGVAVALWVSQAITDPLRRAEAATHRIAAGDLSTRVDAAAVGGGEIEDLARSINTMAEHLERARGTEQQFLLSVSHDLRTPLTSIQGYAEAIADGTAPDPRAAAAVVQSESRRLERLVRDLLDLARLEAREFSLRVADLPVTEVVVETAEGFRHSAEERGIELVVDDDPTGARAAIDPDRIAQVVANLVENGMKYAAHGLRVSTVADPDRVTVLVADDGPGMAPEDLPHVFERLYVSRHRPARRESGSGLGLAIVRELAVAMGGSVAAQSPLGPHGGTRMIVVLPRRPAPTGPPGPEGLPLGS